MKLVWKLLAIAFLMTISPPIRADEPPYLDFVRSLREKRRAPDLALEYLQELVKKPNLPKDLVDFLPLEMAQCRMELAQLETDTDARNRILAQAASPGSCQSAQSALERTVAVVPRLRS